MFKALFERKKKSNVTPPNIQPATVSNDREEDGFVLLGETAVERSTVLPERLSGATDTPPSYNACVTSSNIRGPTMGQQPSNQKVVRQTGALDSSQNSLSAFNTSPYSGASPRPPSTPNRKRDFTEVTIQDNNPMIPSNNRKPAASWEASQVTLSQHRTPVHDVPFKLGEFYQFAQRNRAGAFTCFERIPQVNMGDYHYNFELERSVVREFNNSG